MSRQTQPVLRANETEYSCVGCPRSEHATLAKNAMRKRRRNIKSSNRALHYTLSSRPPPRPYVARFARLRHGSEILALAALAPAPSPGLVRTGRGHPSRHLCRAAEGVLLFHLEYLAVPLVLPLFDQKTQHTKDEKVIGCRAAPSCVLQVFCAPHRRRAQLPHETPNHTILCYTTLLLVHTCA